MIKLKVRFNGWFKVTGEDDPFAPVPVRLKNGETARMNFAGWITLDQAKAKGMRPVKIVAFGWSADDIHWTFVDERTEFVQGAVSGRDVWGVTVDGEPRII